MSSPSSETVRHATLARRYQEACAATDALFDAVKPEHLYDRPIPERHRIVFYIGHLEAFDWNLLGPRMFAGAAIDAELERLFAFGIDPVGGGLPTDVPADWPSLAKVHAYRDAVRGAVADGWRDLGSGAAAPAAQTPAEAEVWLNVAIEHRLMHAETLAYMLHQLDPAKKQGPVPAVREHREAAAAAMMEVPAGEVVLGMPRGSSRFGWDNEFGERRVDVPAFRIDRHMVSNGEFLRFVEAGGYASQQYWREADWTWRTEAGITHPAFWRRRGDAWYQLTMFGEVPLPLDWPVYVSHAEAAAYARYVGKRLPTEAEWQRAASGIPDASQGTVEGNFNFRNWDPAPVDLAQNRSEFGVLGLYGNGWEWTDEVFAPLPGFEAFSFYPGYSANFFDGQHYVLKGGSARTAACMLRPSFRNWFQPHYQYVYAGLRCVAEA